MSEISLILALNWVLILRLDYQAAVSTYCIILSVHTYVELAMG